MLTAFLALVLSAFALFAARHWHLLQRRERRLQTRLIRALHAEFGRSGGQVFRPRA